MNSSVARGAERGRELWMYVRRMEEEETYFMSFSISTGFYLAWGALGVVWLVSSFFVKATARSTSSLVRMLQSLMMLAGYLLISGWAHLGWLDTEIWPQTMRVAESALAITCLGVFYAIWARLTLGRNWSAKPTVKQEHELIVRGPYALTRHPIYSGMLLASVGTALAVDAWRVLPGIALLLLAFAIKIRQEERLMSECFPDSYPGYRRRVKALLPWIV